MLSFVNIELFIWLTFVSVAAWDLWKTVAFTLCFLWISLYCIFVCLCWYLVYHIISEVYRIMGCEVIQTSITYCIYKTEQLLFLKLVFYSEPQKADGILPSALCVAGQTAWQPSLRMR